MEVNVNYLAVLAAAALSMALGFLWYSPAVLGKPWMKLKGYTSEALKAEQKKMGPLYGLSFLVALVTAYVLTHIMTLSRNFYGYDPVMTGVTSAFWAWLGFVMPVQVTATIFGDNLPAGRHGKWQLLGIDSGYQLVSLLAMGVVIGYLGR